MVSRVALFDAGDRSVVVGSAFVALVDGPVDSELSVGLGRLAVTGAAALDDVLDVLVAVPLRSLPDFALVVGSQGGAVAVVRGELEVAVTTSTGVERFDAAGFRTWRERELSALGTVSLGGGPGVEEASAWMGWGLTRGGSVTWIDVEALDGLVAGSMRIDNTTTRQEYEPTVMDGMSESEAEEHPNEVTRIETWFDSVDGTEGDTTLSPDLLTKEPAYPANSQDERADACVDAGVVVESNAEPETSDGLDVEIPTAEPEPGDAEPVDGSAGDGSDQSDYDHLFDFTRPRTVEQAAVRVTDPPAPGGAPASALLSVAAPPPLVAPAITGVPGGASHDTVPPLGDHDGHTRTLASIQAAPGPMPSGVPASRCPKGHLNPPHTEVCRVCWVSVLGATELVERVEVGILVLPDGDRVSVDRTVLIGRNPGSDVTFEGELPRLIRLSEDKHLSRTHCIIQVSGWTASVVDHGSQNGTVLQVPGRPPELLRAGVPTVVLPGSDIVLAEAVTLRFEVT